MSTLSIIIPTPGLNRPLSRVLNSIKNQPLHEGDEVIVVGDTCDSSLPDVEEIARSFGYKYVSHNAKHHCKGHCQINYGMTIASGDYLAFQDDDDIYVSGAIDAIHQAIDKPPLHPIIFNFITNEGSYLKYHTIKESCIGGHQLVIPNIPIKLGRWTERYEGDFDFIQETLTHWSYSDIEWVDTVIVKQRPSLLFTLTEHKVATPEDVELLRVIRNSGKEWMTSRTTTIEPSEQLQWWDQNKNSVEAYLYKDYDTAVGMSLIRPDKDFYWGTLVVLPEYRNLGVGTYIYKHMVRYANSTHTSVKLLIRPGNAASIHAAKKAGFNYEGIMGSNYLFRSQQ